MSAPVAHQEYGPYRLMLSDADRLWIRRLDADGRTRGVAVIESCAQWDVFVAALKSGADEVAAVHAIDAKAGTS